MAKETACRACSKPNGMTVASALSRNVMPWFHFHVRLYMSEHENLTSKVSITSFVCA